jgi:hypothetical protein
VQGISTIKTAWPTVEKSLVSVLLTKSGKLFSVANAVKTLGLTYWSVDQVRNKVCCLCIVTVGAVKAEFKVVHNT